MSRDIIIPGGWRDAQKEKPPEGEMVIVILKNGRRGVGCYQKGLWWSLYMEPDSDALFWDHEVKLWAPLPEPLEEVRND